jgi:hypothetical protein
MAKMRKFKTIPQTFDAIEIKTTLILNGKEFHPGDFIMIGEDGEQYYYTKDQVESTLVECKPRAKRPSEVKKSNSKKSA